MDDATSASLLESGEVLPDMTDDDGGAEEKGGRCKFYTNLTRIQLQWSGPVVGRYKLVIVMSTYMESSNGINYTRCIQFSQGIPSRCTRNSLV